MEAQLIERSCNFKIRLQTVRSTVSTTVNGGKTSCASVSSRSRCASDRLARGPSACVHYGEIGSSRLAENGLASCLHGAWWCVVIHLSGTAMDNGVSLHRSCWMFLIIEGGDIHVCLGHVARFVDEHLSPRSNKWDFSVWYQWRAASVRPYAAVLRRHSTFWGRLASFGGKSTSLSSLFPCRKAFSTSIVWIDQLLLIITFMAAIVDSREAVGAYVCRRSMSLSSCPWIQSLDLTYRAPDASFFHISTHSVRRALLLSWGLLTVNSSKTWWSLQPANSLSLALCTRELFILISSGRIGTASRTSFVVEQIPKMPRSEEGTDVPKKSGGLVARWGREFPDGWLAGDSEMSSDEVCAFAEGLLVACDCSSDRDSALIKLIGAWAVWALTRGSDGGVVARSVLWSSSVVRKSPEEVSITSK